MESKFDVRWVRRDSRDSEPAAQARGLVGRVLLQQTVEAGDQPADCSLVATRVLRGVHEDQAVVSLAALVAAIGDDREVADVLGQDGAPLLLGNVEDILVGQRAQLGSGGYGVDIVPASAQLLGDRGRVHLVEQEPQASAACSRSHAA
jgi:hypothetical protein